MASLTYTNIETRVMNALRIPTSNSTEQAKIAALINEAYRDICAWGDGQWWWLVKRGLIATRADITTGTASVTNNSTSVTLTDAPATSVADGSVAGPAKFYVDGNTLDAGAVYRVSAHTAASASVTLDGVYTGGTDSAAAYHFWFDEYSLASDVGKIQSIRRYGWNQPLRIISPVDMHAIKSWDTSVGPPQMAALIDFDTTGDPTTVQHLILHPYPDEIYRIEYTYFQTLNTELSSTTQPFIPDDYRQLLVYRALALGYPAYLNDIQRGTYFNSLYLDGMQRMMTVQRRHQGNPSVEVIDQHRNFYRRGRRMSSANVDLGSYFDRLPNNP